MEATALDTASGHQSLEGLQGRGLGGHCFGLQWEGEEGVTGTLTGKLEISMTHEGFRLKTSL